MVEVGSTRRGRGRGGCMLHRYYSPNLERRTMRAIEHIISVPSYGLATKPMVFAFSPTLGGKVSR